jgi:hypothetical protein
MREVADSVRATHERRITKNFSIIYAKKQKGDDIMYTCECVESGNRTVATILAGVPELSWEEIERLPQFVNFSGGQITIEADTLAQDVVDAWENAIQGGVSDALSVDLRALFETCRIYRDARRLADNRRKFNLLSVEQASAEEGTRNDFLDSQCRFSAKHG